MFPTKKKNKHIYIKSSKGPGLKKKKKKKINLNVTFLVKIRLTGIRLTNQAILVLETRVFLCQLLNGKLVFDY